ncbi:CbtA family protein [Hyphomicrobium sp.]|uniref:CbtA family protein n=1 Tax=Hyphomicrobium sp. TaxID=82 RepID=UPI002D78A404|nr:CbtA family protein [Hyphomicrobium sp.]HET6390444.1 CbtA family protein [Hyphomicrobium sp.]
MGALLVRGMIAGLIASLLAFAFAKVIGEPHIDRAIAFEEAAQSHAHGADGEPELVSRDVQASTGLLAGVALYGTALGGLFALAYAFVSGRLLHLSPRSTALVIAAIGFLALYFVPYLKYPANPPAVGQGETIAYRTQLYFAMVVVSLLALTIAVSFGRQVFQKFGGWNASMLGIGTYLLLVSLAAFALPAINEVPETFPADLLWNFRLASLGTQFILWAAIGLLFGWLIALDHERVAR